MSDYNPGPGGPYDKYGNDKYGNPNFEPTDTGRGPYVLLGILVAIGLIGGLLYFNGTPKDRSNVANAPPAIERPMTAPAPAPVTPAPVTPAPAPSTTDNGVQKQ